jgi:hypothetical protein
MAFQLSINKGLPSCGGCGTADSLGKEQIKAQFLRLHRLQLSKTVATRKQIVKMKFILSIIALLPLAL